MDILKTEEVDAMAVEAGYLGYATSTIHEIPNKKIWAVHAAFLALEKHLEAQKRESDKSQCCLLS